jgi:uncharacterized protein YjbJ (UPF0337 family)
LGCGGDTEASPESHFLYRDLGKLSEIKMNQDRRASAWKQLTGSVKEHWGELTDTPLVALAGRRDQIAGRIQER